MVLYKPLPPHFWFCCEAYKSPQYRGAASNRNKDQIYQDASLSGSVLIAPAVIHPGGTVCSRRVSPF